MNKRVKVFSFVLSFIMIVILSVGTTLALLTDKTDDVKNTFTATTNLLKSDATFMIQEHEVDANFKKTDVIAQKTGDVYVDYNGLFPGITVDKDPTVLVGELNAAAYLYVVINQENMSAAPEDDLFNWAAADTWLPLGTEGNKTLYVYKDGAGTGAKAFAAGVNPTEAGGFAILAGNKVNVENYTSDVDTDIIKGYMSFSAYLVQAFGVDADTAADALAAYNSAFTATFVAPVQG